MPLTHTRDCAGEGAFGAVCIILRFLLVVRPQEEVVLGGKSAHYRASSAQLFSFMTMFCKLLDMHIGSLKPSGAYVVFLNYIFVLFLAAFRPVVFIFRVHQCFIFNGYFLVSNYSFPSLPYTHCSFSYL